MYKWQELPWKKIERAVFKLQKRIYQASQGGDRQTVHKLQRLLIKSWTARCLAVRRVTQDNRGKNTAGVDGVKSLIPPERLQLAQTLTLDCQTPPTRRVWIPKAGKTEKRPLGIPSMRNRAEQALVKMALEPEWEARFEPNSYGFRPGRSCHDAIEAIFNAVSHKAKYVLDADIAQCFDRINHKALMNKLNTYPALHRVILAWLKAGVMDGEELFSTTEGTPQGGVASPLLANIALHGMEEAIVSRHPNTYVIRYADDVVAIHPDLKVIEKVQQTMSEWLATMGLELKPSKTRITHTLKHHQGQVGFDFLGFHIRQYRKGKTHTAKSSGRSPKPLGFKTITKPSQEAQHRHYQALKRVIDRQCANKQEQLIGQLNPIIKGWTAYYAPACSKKVFAKMAHLTYLKLKRWAKWRHPRKSWRYVSHKYWRLERGRWEFAPPKGPALYKHYQTPIKRHIKVKGSKSAYDGDWVYWAKRRGRQPGLPKRTAVLLKRQTGKCNICGLYFRKESIALEGSEVLVTKANLLRSGVLRKAHAPFWSSAREGDLPGNCNWVKVPPA
jgi:RNA-directed DNA polymerase